MSKDYVSMGLMSGTSGDGVDVSIIKSNGEDEYTVILDNYIKYNNEIFEQIHQLKEKIISKIDLVNFTIEIKELERKITLFHAKVVENIPQSQNVDLIGFHGQTIYHNADEKISKQIGNGKLLSQLSKKDLIYNFRENDIQNGGQGAPLTPVFHHLIVQQKKIKIPVCVLNIGGISNLTLISSDGLENIESRDIGPGNCLIDEWVRKNSKNRFDKDGLLANRGLVNEIILEQAQELFANSSRKESTSLDVKDFDVSFARGLNLSDGAATLTEFTSQIIASNLLFILKKFEKKNVNIILCGGGRKNKILINKITNKVSNNFNFQNIDDYNINGDFIESQAFAYLAIRSKLKLPISFPNTTKCKKPISGGDMVKYI